ncbi:TetR family transcriptional regulator [Agromyces sp. NPDC058484]|uniref:TetR family transcriptional regulator n=1 Tax=Agromyces sp. NPDC058484 TaxID=3346524 RepID=UPI00365F2364
MREFHVADDVTRAAVELFARQGYANTSVQQIVEAAGVTKGAMYHERGQAEGLYRTDIPMALLIAHFFSDAHYLSHWYSPEGPEDKTLVAEQLTDLFLTTLRRADAST